MNCVLVNIGGGGGDGLFTALHKVEKILGCDEKKALNRAEWKMMDKQ